MKGQGPSFRASALAAVCLVAVVAFGGPRVADATVTHIRITGPTKATAFAEVQQDTHVVSDGVRYVAFYVSRHARFRLYDTWGNRVLRPRTRCAPEDAWEPEAAVPGFFLTTCSQLLDATTLQAKRIRGARFGDTFDQLGRYWVEGLTDPDCPDGTDDCGAVVAINWHTGRRVTCGDPPHRRCPANDWDLNSPKLRAVRRNHPRPDLLQTGTIGYDDPYRLEQSVVGSDQVLRLRRGRESIRLAQRRCCWPNPFNGSVSAGWATWTTSRHRHVYSAGAMKLSTRRRLTWTISGVPYPFAENVISGFPPYVWHTANGVVFQTLKRYDVDNIGGLSVETYQLAYAPFPR